MIPKTDILAHLGQDPHLGPVVRQIEFPDLDMDRQVFSSLLRSVVSQQLSTKAAATIHLRFLDLYDGMPPEPERVQDTDVETLRAVGLSRQKASYLHNISDFFLQNNYQEGDWAQMADDEIIETLTTIKGVGKWTVEMILMFTLHRPDVFPTDDLGIQKAMMKLFDFEEKGRPLHQKMRALAEPWRPYRTYASFYLWKTLE